MKIEVIYPKVVELGEEEEEVEKTSTMEESSLTKKPYHSQCVVFIKEAIMLRKIVGSKGSLNALIVKKFCIQIC